MHALEAILFLLAAVAVSSILERVLPRLSLPIVQIALGAIIALFWTTPFSGGIDAELLLILFIAPLHFNESRHADSGALWKNRWGITSLAAGLVVAIVISVGFTLHVLLPAIPLAAALAFGAAMGSTDAPAVMELSKDFKFGRHHKTLLEGEAFFNDVTGTVIFQCAIAVAVSGSFSIAHAGEEFALDLFGGFFGGAILGGLAWLLLEFIRKCGIDSPTLHVTLELLLPFVIFLIAKQLHIGAVIAVVSAGLVMSLLPHRHTAQMARQKIQSSSVWDTLGFILNGIIFIILGMQLPQIFEFLSSGSNIDPAFILITILVITFVLEAVRFLWILGMDMVHAKHAGHTSADCFTRASLKGTLAMAFAGPKGGITLSLMLTIPLALASGEAFAARQELISIASGVILCTLLLANFGVPLLVAHKHDVKRTKAQVDVEIEIIERTIASIHEDAPLTGDIRSMKPIDSLSVEGTQHAIATHKADDGSAMFFDIDEPATVIVMKRYADQLSDLLPHASKEAANRARTIISVCDELYGRIDQIAEDMFKVTDGEDNDASEQDNSALDEYFRGLRAVYEAVEDVQEQALTRELEIIKSLREAGRLSATRARALRDEVYMQQLTL